MNAHMNKITHYTQQMINRLTADWQKRNPVYSGLISLYIYIILNTLKDIQHY